MTILTHTVAVAPLGFKPSLVQGDADLWGKADINAWVRVRISDNQRAFRIECGMTVREPGWDYTTMEGTYAKTWYELPMPGRIVGLRSAESSSVSYRDTSWEDDIFLGKHDDLVRRWVIRGDRNGPDVGHTSMQMEFNPVVLVVNTDK